MNTGTDNYTLLIRKLDEFIRKYYVNQLLRGAIFSVAILLAAFLIIEVLEYFFYFPSTVRAVLFFGFLGSALFIIGGWIVRPLLHYFRLGQLISHEQAAQIIGAHFTNVQDRLLNILQLKKQAGSLADASLVEASINQKITALKPVPFASAVNLSLNKKYLRYLILPVLALAFILFSSPNILKDSTLRLLNHNDYFERKAPFRFSVLNEPLQAVQYEDFELLVKVEGDVLPDEAFIEINGFQYPLRKKSPAEFVYTVVKPQKEVAFFFSANGFRSRDFTLEVVLKPVILKFETALDFPAYLGRADESLQNIGDLNVPEGTVIEWRFISQNTSGVAMQFSDSMVNTMAAADDQFHYTRRVRNDEAYKVFISGPRLPMADSIGYSITVIPDRHPALSVSQLSDSTNNQYLYFAGEASDDYGLKNLYFRYRIEKEDNGGEEKFQSVPVQVVSGKYSQFSHYWDLSTLKLAPGDRVSYFFEVWDNDGVNGSKYTRSAIKSLDKPTEVEMKEQTEQDSEQIKDDLEASIKEAEKLKEEFAEMQQDLLNKKNPSWEDKKKIEELLQRQQELNKRIEDIQKSFSENLEKQNEYREFSEDTRKKAEQLEKLMEEVLTPEMREMLEKLQEMLDQLNKDKALDELQDQQLNNEQLEKELDRMLSLFKQLEFEKKMSDTQEKLDQLAKEQEELAKETEQAEKQDESTRKELENKQQEIENEFKEVEKDLDDLGKMNEELDQPNQMPDLGEQQQKAGEEINKAQENMSKGSNKKASESQKNAAKQMQEMSKKMEESMQSMQMEQTEMDMQKTRQILENLVKVSFDQEELLNKTKGVNVYNPQYLQVMKEQKDLQDDLQMIEDSIRELSKTVYQIQNFVNEQLTDIDKNMRQGLASLEQRRPANASVNQQRIMTDVNNLALMFDEVLQQLQQQMANQMAGSQMCSKPGGSKQSMQSLKNMQKQLNDRIQQMGQQMKEGKMPRNGQGTSEQMAQMAQEQAKIREAIRQMNEELNKDGKNSLGDLNKLQNEMEKTETELLNKQITEEMKRRQQDILTRLLEAENAERQRETENRRESKSGTEMVKKLPPEIEEYLAKKRAESELFKTVPADLKPFYRDLVEQYFKSLQQ